MRWNHPERGFVSPSIFIPLAEQSELIVELSSFALEQAARTAAQWRRDGLTWQVGVNLSASQIDDPTLVATIDRALAVAGLPAESLVVEITEGMAIAHLDAAVSTLDQLRQRGINVVLDDFGTGYSSLAYVARLRPTTIKIDRGFLASALEHQSDRNVLRAVVDFCRNLGLLVLAEGVETPQELDLLLELEVDLVQGFYFSPAVPASDIRAAVERVSEAWHREPSDSIPTGPLV